jgi:hypothetical protein
MKSPLEPDDALVNSLVEETKSLPQLAAAHARSGRRARRIVVQTSATLAALTLITSLWYFQTTERDAQNERAVDVRPLENNTPASHAGYVRVYEAGELPEIVTLPPDATEREKQLWAELPGVPVLIVKNNAGEITRIHVFER